ncbi:DUF92 domain-containing protein [Halalkalibacter nanhaiisediminis]|uniref:Uncharacterized protein (TIGR00297 family) n=1 Tax=Halalkalibacter nanhaiisediminis TaxID=688079 RepID=A0A562QM46_9BACI|nr:DUF92 domain-containing protein [Halalkalibacter nanhaiisediminis]TWI57814.1 uncharacterized protein (TIGR00297 family) [Halalkalibacter nanhaiisediminis]
MIIFLLVGVLIFSVYAFVTKKLTLSGAIAAAVVGSSITIGFQLFGLLLLALFFFSSNIFSALKRKQIKEIEEITEKGDRRDAMQVMANGGVAAILSVFYLLFPSPLIICGFVASLAAANADTWASEIGAFSKNQPFHLLKWRQVPPGTSGAITALGSAAAFAGSFIIVVFAIFFWWGSHYNSHLLLMALIVAGFIGNLFDTLLGALCQVVYRCPVCGLETERKIHCDELTERTYGVKWINNDMVNIGCTIVGAIGGIGAGWLLL